MLSVAVVWIGTARASGLEADLEAAGALEPCAAVPDCMTLTNELVANELRSGSLGAEAFGVALSPAVVRGTGGLIELSAQSLAMPGATAPVGVGILPVVPRLGIGGVTGTRTRFGGGVSLAAAVPTHATEIGFGGGVRLGVAFGDPDGRRRVGFEADGGVGVVQGRLVDRPLDAVAGLDLAVPVDGVGCGPTCLDQAVFGYAGLDTVLAYDIDETTVLALRLGGVFHTGAFDVATARARWAWREISPRIGMIAAYRPDPRALLGAAVRLGLVQPSITTDRSRVSWTGALTFGWRFGTEVAPTPILPVISPPPPPPPPAPRTVPKVLVAEHPELDCGPDHLPTGFPPPLGLKGWCVTILEPELVVVRDGPHVEWHDPEHVSVRGQFTRDRESGVWTWYAVDGTPVAWGAYVDGFREGTWRTLDAQGARGEGLFVRGRQEGPWTLWASNGGTTVATFRNGERDGLWRVYDATGRLVREVQYRSGLIIYENRSP